MSENCCARKFHIHNSAKDLYSGHLKVYLTIGAVINGFVLLIFCSQLIRSVSTRLSNLKEELLLTNGTNISSLTVESSAIERQYLLLIAAAAVTGIDLCLTVISIVLVVYGQHRLMSKTFTGAVVALTAVIIMAVFLTETVFSGEIEKEIQALLDHAESMATPSAVYESIKTDYSCCSQVTQFGNGSKVQLENDGITISTSAATSAAASVASSTIASMQHLGCSECLFVLIHQFVGKVLVSCILAALMVLAIIHLLLIIGCMRRLNARIRVQRDLLDMGSGGLESGQLPLQQWDMLIPMLDLRRPD